MVIWSVSQQWTEWEESSVLVANHDVPQDRRAGGN